MRPFIKYRNARRFWVFESIWCLSSIFFDIHGSVGPVFHDFSRIFVIFQNFPKFSDIFFYLLKSHASARFKNKKTKNLENIFTKRKVLWKSRQIGHKIESKNSKSSIRYGLHIECKQQEIRLQGPKSRNFESQVRGLATRPQTAENLTTRFQITRSRTVCKRPCYLGLVPCNSLPFKFPTVWEIFSNFLLPLTYSSLLATFSQIPTLGCRQIPYCLRPNFQIPTVGNKITKSQT